MFNRQILAMLIVGSAYSSLYADKVLAGSPLVFTGVHWQSNTINLNNIRNQMDSVPMIVEESPDTCFTRRVASNQAVLSTICNHTDADGKPEMHAIQASVRLCAPDSLVSFATFNEYLLEQLDWLAAIDAIQLTPIQKEALISDSKLNGNLYGAYYFVDSLKFFNFIGGGGCPYNPGNLPVPTTKSSVKNNAMERIANNNRLIWRGLSNSANYKVTLQSVSGRQLASQAIKVHGGQLEWEGNIPSKPFLATIQSDDDSLVWSAMVP